jgi:hypothetical protein
MSANPNQSYQSSNWPDDDDGEEYPVVPAIPVDYRHHTDEHPESIELGCDYQQERIADLIQAYQDGLVSPDDMTRIASGKTV